MSVITIIYCDRCGRDLFRMPTVKELREKRSIHIPEHYIINDNGIPENLCASCYQPWLSKTKEA